MWVEDAWKQGWAVRRPGNSLPAWGKGIIFRTRYRPRGWETGRGKFNRISAKHPDMEVLIVLDVSRGEVEKDLAEQPGFELVPAGRHLDCFEAHFREAFGSRPNTVSLSILFCVIWCPHDDGVSGSRMAGGGWKVDGSTQ